MALSSRVPRPASTRQADVLTIRNAAGRVRGRGQGPYITNERLSRQGVPSFPVSTNGEERPLSSEELDRKG
jgi:hypothetical protein